MIEKNGEFISGDSSCDFCGSPAIDVDENGVATCRSCQKTHKFEKTAGDLNWDKNAKKRDRSSE